MTSELFKKGIKSDILVVAFSGYAQAYDGIPPFEFVNYLTQHFPEPDKLFYKDTYCSSYHKGIQGISKNIQQTKDYLQQKIKDYSKVIFTGNSGGGYGAILFGSLLNVDSVLAFMPPTILYKPDKDPIYKNLAPFINNTTYYLIYGNLSITCFDNPHHIRHCENIDIKPNVNVIKMENLSVKALRNSGALVNIINSVIK
jgi:hypothetical protein